MPERPIVFWLGRVLGAAMPETTVHKDCEPGLWKNEIRFTDYRLMTPPSGDFVPTK